MDTPGDLSSANDRLLRLGRLILKELREILRDRRTIVTLVLMPLLMYPLLSVAFKQFFVSQLNAVKTTRYRLALDDDTRGHYFRELFRGVGMPVIDAGDDQAAAEYHGKSPLVEMGLQRNLADQLLNYDLHVALKVTAPAEIHADPQRNLALKVELLYREDWGASREAAVYVEKYLAMANEKFLEARLKVLRVSQPAAAIQVVRQPVEGEHSGESGAVSITAIIPFILILMTVTGAVYPAIDLTAGERERGTLEVLVAAPIPRMGVLLAKYVAVLTVALLTATANLLTMTVTVVVGGFGKMLFGETGMSAGGIAAVFALLLLFAAFFSAVLLAVTSTARSFKEAQAYLIPLMLVSLAPGILSLMPDVELSGLLLVTPLANIVLLGRDLLKMEASPFATLIVVASTLLYAGAAIGIAARVFGAESVLYSSQSGWSDLFRRPRVPQTTPTVTAATFCLACMLPAYILLFSLMSTWATDLMQQQIAGVLMTVAVFGGIPALACQMRGVRIAPAFRMPPRPLGVFLSAMILGGTFWVFSYEAVQIMQYLRGASFDDQSLEALREFSGKLKQLPLPLTLCTMALVPAVFEESFFRGYLFPALHTKTTTATTIVVSAIAFGLFHAINPSPLAPERVVSTTLVGLLLGWVRWRTGSTLPGILLHAVNNALVFVPVYFEQQLADLGIGTMHAQHLPVNWIVGGSVCVAIGVVGMIWATHQPPNRTKVASSGA
ncbi:MAG: CPBP family intramembrane metalloprotease [Planctomycetes bacterium]|nr:CPBP family intramembrane metalloprotease [Planctomycetota bacterium]